MSASSLTKHRDKLLELMSDVLYNPAFSADELAKLKTQKAVGARLRQRRSYCHHGKRENRVGVWKESHVR